MKHIYLLFVAVFAIQTAQTQIVNIPDANFKKALRYTDCVDTDGDGIYDDDVDTNNDHEIQLAEAQAVLRLNVGRPIGAFFGFGEIESLEGLASFTNLEYLDVSGSALTTLEHIEPLSNLKNLNFARNELVSIDSFSGLLYLESLDLAGNDLTSINLSLFPNITYLNCYSNNLTNLDLSPIANLENLNCGYNDIISLDITVTPNLIELVCYNNQIGALDFSNSLVLEELNFRNNPTGAVVIDHLTNLRLLDCSSNGLIDLEINSLSNLTNLACSDNFLTELTVNSNAALESLKFANNQITTFDFTQFPTLKSIEIQNNLLTELNTDNLVLLENLFCSNNQISTSLNLTNSPNLFHLLCDNNLITEINVSGLTHLDWFECDNNLLTSLDVSDNENLYSLNCSNNLLTNLNVDNTNLYDGLHCNNNQLTELDLSSLSSNYAITSFNGSNNQLTTLNLKNGHNNVYSLYCDDCYGYFNLEGNPNLELICSDEGVEANTLQGYINSLGYDNCVISEYCGFIPGGTYYSVQGTSKLDSNDDSCDENDDVYSNLKLNVLQNGNIRGSIISSNSGDYIVYTDTYANQIVPVIENNYFTISPESIEFDFPTDISPYIQDFCITPIGIYNDLEITIVPLEDARPGFDTNYKIFYKNKGTTTLSGTVALTFDDNLMDLVTSNPIADSQTVNNLSWNYTNLLPFESREILVTMNLNTPMDIPPLNGDDVLGFTATVNPVTGDETVDDNTFELNQLVVNSYDPNDKTCLEGNTITPDLIGEYVNYLIRFENTGTASAINVVVKDIIDIAKFDIATLFLTDSSHDLVTKITYNKVEFIFENINLPFDDANNDGYIAFKIKTLDTLVEGDTFENDAEIYFDYNFPIQTNVAQTSIQSPLSTNDFELSGLEIYPNPSQDKLSITGLEGIRSVTIYDISGRLINKVSFIGNRNNIDISTEKLVQGTYLVKVKTDVGETIRKFIKK